jgi:NitT/TauT family transport system permease protein
MADSDAGSGAGTGTATSLPTHGEGASKTVGATAGASLRASHKGTWLHPSTWAPPVVTFALILALWEVLALRDHYLLPTIGSVVHQLGHYPLTYLANGGDTLAEALPGVAISYAVALLMAIAMSQSRLVMRAVLPAAVVLNVTPLIAVAPALGVALGLGRAPKIVLAALITFFPTLINAIAGLRSADPQALEVLQTLHASRWDILWRLQLPSSLPYLFAAARVVVPLAVIGAAISEMVSNGTSSGLGWYIATWSSNSQLDLAWAGIATLALLGLALTGIVVFIEDRILRWRGLR